MTEAGDFERERVLQTRENYGEQRLAGAGMMAQKNKIDLSQKNFLRQYHQSPNPWYLPCSTLGTSPD
jgi:hypothetical protein